MPTPASQRAKKHGQALRAAGLRPVQIWVPDTRQPGFAEGCRRQALTVAADGQLGSFLDAALADLDDEA